jgi:hypothetical protein
MQNCSSRFVRREIPYFFHRQRERIASLCPVRTAVRP